MTSQKEDKPIIILEAGQNEQTGHSSGPPPLNSTIRPLRPARKESTHQQNPLSSANENIHEIIKRQAEGFAAVLHDINNQLSVLKSAVEVITINNPSLSADPENKEDLAAAESAIKKISGIANETMNRLREFLLIQEPKLTPINIKKLIFDTFANSGVTCLLALKTEITDFQADRMQIERMLFNLLDNANKYGKAKEKGIELNVSFDNGYLVFEVKDFGDGIKEDTDKIFENFYRQGTEKGFGLGLGFCKRVAEMHGGTISAFNNTDVDGATFVLAIPYIPATKPKI